MMPGGPVPPPFGPPPQGAISPMGAPARATNPMDLVAAMRDLVGTPVKRPEPIYRPGYVKPKRPPIEQVHATGKRLYDANRNWRWLIYQTLKWVRQELTGAFPEDIRERQLGFQEEYISSALSDERNLIISKGAAFKPSFRASWTKPELRGYAQRLEDAVAWLRDMERYRSADGGNRPLEIDEWALLADYGMYVSRDTFDGRRTDCPIDMRLIDPCQVHPVWDRRDGLAEVYRVYWDTTREITAAYGDFAPSQMTKLKNEIGTDITDETEHEVIEWWNSWDRCVLVGGVTMLGMTEHKYGDVPYTVQYGGFGEPLFTRTSPAGVAQRSNNQWHQTASTRSDERMAKAVPYLYYRMRSHEIYEAVMARMLTGFKKDINPPTIRYRTDAAAEKPMPALDGSAGAQNEAMYGEEKIEALPTTDLAKANLMLTQLTQDRMTGSAPPEMFGRIDKSNVTGVAQSGANDAGMHLLFPMTLSLQVALERKYDRVIRMLGNFGEMAAYGNGAKQPIRVPVTRRAKPGQPTAYEFDREVIEKVGSKVVATFSKVDPRDWPSLAAAGKNMVDGGFALRREIRAIATGDHDYDTFYEEWMEENALFGALQLPEFQKINVAVQLAAQIAENEGSPDRQAALKRVLDVWLQTIAATMQPQGQPGMGGGQPGMGQPQQPGMPGQMSQQQLPPGSPQQALQIPPQVGASPGVPGQMSYPAMGAGPGSQGAPVGRPY